MGKLKVGIVQQSCSEKKEENIAKSLTEIQECAAKGAKLIVLQELHSSIYFCQAEEPAMFDLAEPFPGPTYDRFSTIAKSLGIVLVTSLF